MPLSPTTYMALIRPTPGGDDDVWDDLWNTIGGQIDGHRHITGEGRPIPTAGLSIDAALPFNNFRATSIAGLAMQNLAAALSSGANEFFVTGGNAYFRNNGGTNVQITNGNFLAVTVAGAFGGDYTSVSAEAAFTDATDTYSFKQQLGAAVRQYGKMASADLLVYEYKAHPAAGVPANAIRIKSPAALAGSYDWIFAGALPGTQQIVQVDNVGQLSYSNTIAQLLTANAGVTIPAAQTLTVNGVVNFSSATSFRTPSRNVAVDMSSVQVVSNCSYQAAGGVVFSGIGSCDFPLSVVEGDRITSVVFFYSRDSATTLRASLYSRSSATGVATEICSKEISAGSGAGNTDIGVSPTAGSLPQDVAANTTYFLRFVAATLDDLYVIKAAVSHPV